MCITCLLNVDVSILVKSDWHFRFCAVSEKEADLLFYALCNCWNISSELSYDDCYTLKYHIVAAPTSRTLYLSPNTAPACDPRATRARREIDRKSESTMGKMPLVLTSLSSDIENESLWHHFEFDMKYRTLIENYACKSFIKLKRNIMLATLFHKLLSLQECLEYGENLNQTLNY